MSHQPFSYTYGGSGSAPYPPSAEKGNAPYPPNTGMGNPPYPTSTEHPPPYLAASNPPYNPSYTNPDDRSMAGVPLMPQNPPLNYNPPPINYNQPPINYNQPPINYDQPPYPPANQYNGVAQPTVNIAALNSTPRQTYWGGNYGPGWYRYSPAQRKKMYIIFSMIAGLMISVFLVVFVTVTVKAQQDHDAFRKKHFGD